MESLAFFSGIRRSLLVIIVSVMFFHAAAHAFSNPGSLERSSEIRYLGVEDRALVFKITYDNPDSSKFFVTIKDEMGVEIFQNAFTGRKFARKFILRSTDAKKVFFIISDKRSRVIESFEITSETQVMENVVVTRLK